MIRQAEPSDIPELVKRGRDFHAYSPWKEAPYDEGAVANLLGQLPGLFIGDTGMVGGLVSPLWFCPTLLVATELFWWAPTEGQELREAFEQWAKGQGASVVQCSSLYDERRLAVERLYKRAGYAPAEISFLKGV